MTYSAAKVVCTGDLSRGDIWANVWHVELSPLNSPLVESDASDIADEFEGFYTDIQGTYWEAGTTLAEISVQDKNLDGSSPWRFSKVIVPTGGTVMPQILANVITLKNDTTTGPSNRGRVYIPMTRQAALGASGGVSTSARTTLITAIQDLADGLRANTVSQGLVVYSRKLNGLTGVNLVEVDNDAETQRGRQNRSGNLGSTGSVNFGP